MTKFLDSLIYHSYLNFQELLQSKLCTVCFKTFRENITLKLEKKQTNKTSK